MKRSGRLTPSRARATRNRRALQALLLRAVVGGCLACRQGDVDTEVSKSVSTAEPVPGAVETVPALTGESSAVDSTTSDTSTQREASLVRSDTDRALQQAGRRAFPGRVNSLWTHRGTLDDTSLLYPVGVQVHASTVIIADHGAKRLSIHDRATGRQLRTVGRDGSGPGEFRYLSLLPSSNDRAVVYDRSLARLSWWSANGDSLASRSVAGLGTVSGVCGSPEGTLLLKVRPSGPSAVNGIGLLDAGATDLRTVRDLPLRLPPHRSGLGSDAHLRESEDGVCMLAPVSYAWITTVDSVGFGDPLPLIEQVPPPQVLEEPLDKGGVSVTLSPDTPDITRMLALSAHRAFVSVDGKTSVRRRVLDIYQRRPWRYEGSLTVPGRILAVGARDSLLALVQEDDGGMFLRVDVFVVRQD